MSVELSAPFNWCDGFCDRCPLLEGCAAARRIRGRRWVHEMRGEDPDDLRVVLADAAKELERTLEIVRSMAEEEGIALDEPVASPTSLLAVRLRRAATAYVRAVGAIAIPPGREGAAARAASGAMLLCMKVARLCSYEPFERLSEDPCWRADAVPNLLLVERVAADVAAAVAAMEPPREDDVKRYEQASGELRRLLAPWLAAIPDDVRAAIDALIEGGRAPSPWCTTKGG